MGVSNGLSIKPTHAATTQSACARAPVSSGADFAAVGTRPAIGAASWSAWSSQHHSLATEPTIARNVASWPEVSRDQANCGENSIGAGGTGPGFRRAPGKSVSR